MMNHLIRSKMTLMPMKNLWNCFGPTSEYHRQSQKRLYPISHSRANNN